MRRPRSVPIILRMVVYATWLGGFIWLLTEGRYMMYISKHLWPLLAGGGLICFIILLVLGASSELSQKEDESSVDLVNTGILLLPLLYFVFGTGDRLGSYAFSRRSVSVVESLYGGDISAASQEFHTDTLRADLYSLLSDYGNSIGRSVEIEGAIMNSASCISSSQILFRFLIVCCVNDAIPCGIYLKMDSSVVIVDDQWVRVLGIADTIMVDEKIYPCIDCTAVECLPEPDCPYMYP